MSAQDAGSVASDASLPLWARVLLVDARGVERALDRVRASGLAPTTPNTWQITLGVLRMWHRLVFRSDEIGMSSAPRRPGWRARALEPRPLRFPFLVAERAIAPLDFSGLLSSRERVIRHLLGAHHDGQQFAYDLEMLRVHPGALEEVLRRARAVAESDTARAHWLRDLCVFEGYHASLVASTERAIGGDLGLTPEQQRDPDTSFFGYLAWCAAQPATYEDTIAAVRAGRYSIAEGRVDDVVNTNGRAREDLWAMSVPQLRAVLAAGGPVDEADLADADFRGVSLGLPAPIERMTWKTFRKSFRRSEGGGVAGFNVRVEQRGTNAPVVPLVARGEPVTFGPYRVRALDADGTPFHCGAGIVLDYGACHPWWHPLARVRDVVVSIDPERRLLLGACYLELGDRQIETPSFFTLERET